MDADLVLTDLIHSSSYRAVADIEEEFGEKSRLPEALAGNNPLGELPTRIFLEAQRLPDRFYVYYRISYRAL